MNSLPISDNRPQSVTYILYKKLSKYAIHLFLSNTNIYKALLIQNQPEI